MIIDTHSHLNFKAYDNDRDEVIKRTQKEGVVCIDVGTKYETSKRAVELAEKNENIYAAIGMHPIHIKTDLLKLKMDEDEGAFAPLGEEFDKTKYLELAKSKKVVAIGEIGLDYYYKPKTTAKLEQFKQKQKQVFIQQLELAQELNLPVIIHCRMAFKDLYEILKTKKLTGVIHCFTGNLEEAQQFMDLGFYLGINGIIFKLDLDEVIKKALLEKLLVETDCPYLTPPAEGKEKRNEPIFVKHIIQKIADLKGITFDEVALATTQNAQKLFGL
ncbi:MAG: TatD family hydrolase [Candidatus Staskawiczbacteria bacterium]|nr:TatD family hydrolase [Candidatus Staskawiczbacteria bacterium]